MKSRNIEDLNNFSFNHTAHSCSNSNCINPNHLFIVQPSFNYSQKGCKNGFSLLCPHKDFIAKCIWTNNKGQKLLCRSNQFLKKIECVCNRDCFSIHNQPPIIQKSKKQKMI